MYDKIVLFYIMCFVDYKDCKINGRRWWCVVFV